jgi:hypothetical protein
MATPIPRSIADKIRNSGFRSQNPRTEIDQWIAAR